MRKLNRKEYESLRMVEAGNSGRIAESSFEKFLAYGLINEIPAAEKGNYCSYELSELGVKYFEDHPDLPPIVMSNVQAQLIYNFLGVEIYECARSFNSRGGAWNQLKYMGAIEPDIAPGGKSYTGYRLTKEGRYAFEQTEPGRNYLRRVYLKQQQEDAEAAWSKTKSAKIANEVSRMSSKAKFMKKRGLVQHAANIMRELDAKIAKSMVKNALKDIDSKIEISINNDLSIGTITVDAGWHVSNLTYIAGKYMPVAWHVRGNFFVDTSELDYEKLIRQLKNAVEVARIMNEKYPVRIGEDEHGV